MTLLIALLVLPFFLVLLPRLGALLPFLLPLLLVLLFTSASTQESLPWAAARASGDSLARNLEDRIDALASRRIDEGVSVGLVIGFGKAEAFDIRGYGRVSLESDAVPDARTIYEIGSVTKTFTGVLFADAAARGLVALEDPLADHLPEAFIPRWKESPIRLVHLASHVSGLPRLPPNFFPKDLKNPYVGYGARQLYEGLARVKLEVEPGTRFEYSNFGVGTLGHVLERRLEKPLEDALIDRILEPLGLKDTRITLTAPMRERLALPYNEKRQATHLWDFEALAGAGALRSTATDLLAWAEANLHPPESELGAAIRASHEPRAAKEGGRVALGWHLAPDGHTLWHNGGTGGYRSFIAVDPEAEIALVVLANTTSDDIDALGSETLQVLRAPE